MTAGNPVPEGGRFAWLRTADGVKLRAACWPGSKLKGTVLILQGRTESIEKYYETIGELRARGYAVAAFDWRGQGLSDRALPDRQKGHVRDFAEYHRDMDCFLEKFVAPASDLQQPYVILAHSMGAHIAMRYLHDRPGLFARAVLCSPMAYINTAPMPQQLARAIAATGTALGFGESYVPRGSAYTREGEPFENNLLTSDPRRFARNADIIDSNPDLALGSPTLGWLRAAFISTQMAIEPEYCSAIATRSLLIYGDEEKVSLPEYQSMLAEQIPLCQEICIDGARHEILQETDEIRAQFWTAFDRFML